MDHAEKRYGANRLCRNTYQRRAPGPGFLPDRILPSPRGRPRSRGKLPPPSEAFSRSQSRANAVRTTQSSARRWVSGFVPCCLSVILRTTGSDP